MKFKSLILMSAVLLFAGNASATIINCYDGDATGAASSSITTAGDTASATVNTGATANVCGPYSGNDSNAADWTAAGYSGWTELDKYDVDTASGGGIITGDGWGTTSGTFSFGNPGYSSYLIVLKFDCVFSTFLSDSWADGWGWDTDTDNNGSWALSHLTVYVNSTPVPEPAIVGLLSIGLLGMVVARRRMKL